ncbi:outer membrane beta-barrel protein [Mucilaginibacter sp.]|uniref:outer membrane beta-barrel protein n=1 Tax=Mucilaginibacter sp. TaxID=1882438 RepID=UPI0032631497
MQVELIDHIKDELQHFELDYEDGAWENFKNHQNKPKNSVWFLLAKAAVVLVVFCLFLCGLKLGGDKHKVVTFARGKVSHRGEIKRHNEPPHRFMLARLKPSDDVQVAFGASEQPTDNVVVTDRTTGPEQASVITIAPILPAPAKKATAAKTMQDLLQEENGVKDIAANSLPAKGRWSFGFAVGGALDSRQKGNINVGAEVNFKLNERLSINTGVFFNQMGAKKANGGAMATATQDKTLISAEANMSGTELPLQVSYHVNKKFYAKAGISAYAIGRQAQTLQFSEQKPIVSSYIDEKGAVQYENRTFNQISTEAVTPEKLKQNKFVALYNLSFGFVQHIAGDKSLSLEPYLKIPVQDFSEQKLNLSQAGVRVVFNF